MTVFRESLSARRMDLIALQKKIDEEKVKSSDAAAAIALLELAISCLKLAITARSTLVDSLVLSKNYFAKASTIEGPSWEIESPIKALCQTVMARVDSQISGSVEALDTNISEHKQINLENQTSLQVMEAELYSLTLGRAASIQYLSSAQIHKEGIEENILLLKFAMNPARRTPAEIWVKVFSLRLHEDMNNYFHARELQGIPLTVVNISQVCRFWRNIVFTETCLWHYMAIYPKGWWNKSRVEVLKRQSLLRPSNLCLVLELPGRDMPLKDLGNYYSIPAHEASVMVDYNIRVLSRGINPNISSSFAPFRHPASLVLHFSLHASNRAIEALLRPFEGLRGLEIISTGMDGTGFPSLRTTHPHLTYLRVEVLQYGAFDIAQSLGSNLTELHVIRNGPEPGSVNPSRVTLPNLIVLEFALIDSLFTYYLELPLLNRMILYKAKYWRPHLNLTLVHLANTPNFKKTRCLEMHNWNMFWRSWIGNSGVMDLLMEITGRMGSVVTLKFIDSVLDGTRLVTLIHNMKGSNGSDDPLNLEKVVIDCCTGITRNDCETIGSLANSLEVYI